MAVTVNPNLVADLLKIKKLNSTRILLYILDKTIVLESDVAKILGKSVKSIRIAAITLEENELIYIRRNKENNLVYYLLHKKYFDIEDTCRECKFLGSEKISTDEKVIKKLSCKKKGKVCENKHSLGSYNIIKYFLKNSDKCALEIYGKKIKIKEREILTVNWRLKEFIFFYIDLFKRNYNDLIPPSVLDIKTCMKELTNIFKTSSKDNWRRLLKRYIIELYRIHKENNQVLHHQKLTNKITIQNYLKGVGKKVEEIQYCKYFNLNCSFFKLNDCQLSQGHKSCNEGIRDKMFSLYN